MNYPNYYPNSLPQTQIPQTPQNVFSCRPVTSKEEAIASQIDFFNSGTLLPDIAHGKVYLKRFNQQTGASDFLEFTYQPPEEPKPSPQYATIEMLEDLEKRLTSKGKKTDDK